MDLPLNYIYFCNISELKNDDNFALAYAKSNRKAKIDAITHRPARLLSLAAGLLLDFALLERGISHYELIYNEHEKPYLKGLELFFSLSHSGAYALCGLSGKELGCDIELIKKARLGIAKSFFAPSEYERLKSLPSKAKNNEFYTLWSKKESLSKMLGTALPSVLKTKIKDEMLINNQKYFLKNLDLVEGYSSAICSPFENSKITELKISDLLG